jgi:hypothetical protein
MSIKRAPKDEKTTTAKEAKTSSTTHTPTSSPPSSPASIVEEQHQSVNKALDDTKDNINRSIEEAGKNISRNTNSVKDYQMQTIQAFGEIMDSYLHSQKEIISSLQSIWSPYVENAYKMFYTFYPSPQRINEIYINTVNGFVDNLMAMIKLANSVMYSNFDT